MYFLNFIYNVNNETTDYLIKKYSSFAFLNFLKNKNIGERTILPLLSQIKVIMKLNKIPIWIYFTPHNYLETTIELYDTCDDFKY